MRFLLMLMVACLGMVGACGQAGATVRHDVSVATTDVPFDAAASVVKGRYGDAFVPLKTPGTVVRGRNTLWLKVALENTGDEDARRILLVRFPYLEDVALFDGKESAVIRGAAIAHAPDQIRSNVPAFPVVIPAQSKRHVYLRLHGDTIKVLPVELLTEGAFSARQSRETAFVSLLAGIAALLAFQTLFSYYLNRRPIYLFCAWFSASVGTYALLSSGVAKALVFFTLSINPATFVYAAQGSMLCAGSLILSGSLNFRVRAYPAAMLLQGVACLGLVASCLPLLPGFLSTAVAFGAFGLGPMIILGVCGYALICKMPYAALAASAWVFLSGASLWTYLRVFELVPYHPLNHYLVPLACLGALIAFAWSMALMARNLERSARVDSLTKLANRRSLERSIRQLIADGSWRDYTVIQIDLDRFKPVNDRYGHGVGDKILHHAGQAIVANLRPMDIAARIGGDEFTVLVAGADQTAEQIGIIASRLVDAISAPIHCAEASGFVQVGASAGHCSAQSVGSLREAIRAADAALYRAKKACRGTVVGHQDMPRSDPITFEQADTSALGILSPQ